VEFRILGPVEALDDAGEPVAIGGVRERALLARLLLSANEAVSTDRLVGDLWGEQQTAGSLHALRVHISRLRRALLAAGGGHLLLTRPHGYLLQVDPHTVDASRFEGLLAKSRQRATQDDHEAAASSLREALAQWHGPALAGLGDAPFVRAHAARLEETRLAAVEQRIEHDLARGRHTEIVGELDQLTADHPLREGIWGARMLALYRSGRQADALRVYHDLRDLLRDQLGLEPSAKLTGLHQSMLRHESWLDAPQAPAPAACPAPAKQTPPPTRYAKRDGVSIAYQVVGDGPSDLVLVPGFVSNVDLYWEDPGWRQVIEWLTVGRRLILWDKRGTGQSDPVHRAPTLDERVEDLLAVMDAASSERVTLLGISEGGPMSLLLTATHPHRVRSLILYGVTPRFSHAPDWPWGWTQNVIDEALVEIDKNWGNGALLDRFAPTRTGDDVARRAWGRTQRAGASPAMARAVMEAMVDIDCRDILPAITVPTLILHRPGDLISPLSGAQYLVDHIPGARMVQVPGDNHLITFGAIEPIIDEIERFLAQAPSSATSDPATVTVLLTVLVAELLTGSAPPGDQPAAQGWSGTHRSRALRAIELHGGKELPGTDGRLHATFAAPSRAIACATALRAALLPLGLQIRVGIHTGECRLADDRVSGPPVLISGRLAAMARAGEVLVSGTVKDLLAGSAIPFHPRGRHRLTPTSEPMTLHTAAQT